MLTLTPALSPNEPDPALLAKLAWARRACVALVFIGAAVSLVFWLIPALERALPSYCHLMKADAALAALLSALSLYLSEEGHSKAIRRLGFTLAILVALSAAAIVIQIRFHAALGLTLPLPAAQGFNFSEDMSSPTAGSFALLNGTILAFRLRRRLAVYAADLLTAWLCFTVLVVVSGYIFSVIPIFGLTSAIAISPQTPLSLLLLTLAAVLRQAEKGVFSIFLTRSLGGILARTLSPILLAIPFLREAARVRFISLIPLPPYYYTAILASLAATLSMALLLYLCWRIARMEIEIHALSLRDELTGLYNLRGFSLFAEQARRQAQRSRESFSILFIDLDNLKTINDSFGHSAGSACLVEAAGLLQDTFRETEVIGRIGGDEFAVAGQFTQQTLAGAAQRLKEAAASRNTEAGRPASLTFSLGQATATDPHYETVDELLDLADKAMYSEKHGKKLPQSS